MVKLALQTNTIDTREYSPIVGLTQKKNFVARRGERNTQLPELSWEVWMKKEDTHSERLRDDLQVRYEKSQMRSGTTTCN